MKKKRTKIDWQKVSDILLLWLGIYGEVVGLILVFLPLAYDLVMSGFLEFNHISIGTGGVLMMIAGWCLWYFGKKINKKIR